MRFFSGSCGPKQSKNMEKIEATNGKNTRTVAIELQWYLLFVAALSFGVSMINLETSWNDTSPTNLSFDLLGRVSVVRQHSQQQSSLWWRKQHDVHWRCYFAGLCCECAVRLLRRTPNWPFPPFKLIYTFNRKRALFVLPTRCKSECHSPPKSYCAFLALCVARTLLFAGWKMMENGRSKPEWPSRSFLFASSSFHPAAGFLTRTKTVLMAIFCYRGQIL